MKNAGLDLIVNYGLSPFDPRGPMRPDPRSPDCVDRSAECPVLDDGWKYPTWVSDEAVAHPRDLNWDIDYQSNLQNEQHPDHGGQVLGLITVGTLGGDKSRENVFFQWARVKLFDIPLAVAVWDREKACPGVPADEPCTTLLTYPELTSVQVGDPIEARPESDRCAGNRPPRCVWSRRVHGGCDGGQRAEPRDQRVHPEAGDRRVPLRPRRVGPAAPLAGNQCVAEVTLDLAPWSGRPLAYSTTPFPRRLPRR